MELIKVKILVLIVIYNSLLEDSSAYKSFISAIKKRKTNDKLLLFICDNSTEKTYKDKNTRYAKNNTDDFFYIGDGENRGLYSAYSLAYEYSVKEYCEWMLLLDQDTVIKNEFLLLALQYAKEIKNGLLSDDIVSIVPIMKDGRHIVSPRKKICGLWSRKTKQVGHIKNKLVVINSASLLRVDFIKKINGFNDEFIIDGIDHWLYNTIFSQGKSVYVVNVEMEHKLSLLNYSAYVSVDRYISLLDSEWKLVFLHGNKNEELIYILQLMFRFLKQLILIRKINIIKLSLFQIEKCIKKFIVGG